MAFFLVGYPHGARQLRGKGEARFHREPWLMSRWLEAGFSREQWLDGGGPTMAPRCLVKVAPG
eukprot:3793639-Lingulodinium_polyedra.AAC.1